LQVFDGDDGKSTSGGCISVLVILNLSLRIGLILSHMLGLDSGSFLYNMFLLFLCLYFSRKKRKRKRERRCRIIFFLSFNSFSDITCILA
jgi:uncharacterized protein involved in response to NO